MTPIGIALLVVGAIVVIFEAHVPTHGVAGGAGVIVLATGAVLAIGGLGGGVVLAVVTAFVLVAAGFGGVALTVKGSAGARRLHVRQALIGHLGVVRRWEELKGTVQVDGALWQAYPSLPDGDPIEIGDQIVVERVSGLTLAVRKAEDWELVA